MDSFYHNRALQEALELVLGALEERPNHYALQVCRLLLEAHFGLTDEAMLTGIQLLSYWNKQQIAARQRPSANGCLYD